VSYSVDSALTCSQILRTLWSMANGFFLTICIWPFFQRFRRFRRNILKPRIPPNLIHIMRFEHVSAFLANFGCGVWKFGVVVDRSPQQIQSLLLLFFSSFVKKCIYKNFNFGHVWAMLPILHSWRHNRHFIKPFFKGSFLHFFPKNSPSWKLVVF